MNSKTNFPLMSHLGCQSVPSTPKIPAFHIFYLWNVRQVFCHRHATYLPHLSLETEQSGKWWKVIWDMQNCLHFVRKSICFLRIVDTIAIFCLFLLSSICMTTFLFAAAAKLQGRLLFLMRNWKIIEIFFSTSRI